MQQAKAASAAGPGASAADATAMDTSMPPKGKQAKSKPGAAASTQAAPLKKTVGKPGRPAGRAQGAAQKGADKTDAISRLKNDHRTVEQLFKSYEEARATSAKAELARQICMELIIHTQLEEQIFYPACRENGVEDESLDEAQVEHDGAKVMISDLLQGSPDDRYYDVKVKVLKEYIRHHVNEEEKSDEIFAKARQASLDLDEIGARLKSMKDQLTAEGEAVTAAPLEAPSLQLNNINAMSEETQMPRYSNYDYDDDHRSARGRSSQMRDRDDQGRFTSDDDDHRDRSRASRAGYDDDGGRSHRGRQMRDRDDQGRFMSDDDDYRSSRGRHMMERDDQGRFTSDDGYRSSRSSRASYDDDGGSYRGHRGWYDSEGHSRAAHQRQQAQAGDYDDGDDHGMRRGRSQSSRSQSSRGRHEGHGGWFGDSEGHSQAARRGWSHRD
ncbi:MAG: hemerythrin domain-containing protein [Rhodospirillaceae bacterium]